jgi:hypothetical protein
MLTYIGNLTSNKGVSLGLPMLGSVTLGGGGYSHVIVRVKAGRAAEVWYSGETNAMLAPDAYRASHRARLRPPARALGGSVRAPGVNEGWSVGLIICATSDDCADGPRLGMR